MATPVYGKQYIRFAETALVPENLPLSAFTLVEINAAPATEPPTLAVAQGGGCYGVIQQDMPAVDPERAVTLPRQATVATSGLLLVKADGGNLPSQGLGLKVNGAGEAASVGLEVTVNGTQPTVRQLVQIGGVAHVLVSFA
jgi:hypothetical protein